MIVEIADDVKFLCKIQHLHNPQMLNRTDKPFQLETSYVSKRIKAIAQDRRQISPFYFYAQEREFCLCDFVLYLSHVFVRCCCSFFCILACNTFASHSRGSITAGFCRSIIIITLFHIKYFLLIRNRIELESLQSNSLVC